MTDQQFSRGAGIGVAVCIGILVMMVSCVTREAPENKVAAMDQNYDVNGLPKCDSEIATDTAKKAVSNGPLSKVVSIQIFSFEKIEYATRPKPSDTTTKCRADVLSNSGKGILNYTIRRSSDGGIYVQAELSGRDTTDDDKFVVEVGGTRGMPFSGSCLVIADNGNSSTQDAAGKVPLSFTMAGSMVSCTIQKQRVSGELRVTIKRGSGVVVATSSTSEPYGVADTAGR